MRKQAKSKMGLCLLTNRNSSTIFGSEHAINIVLALFNNLVQGYIDSYWMDT